MCYFIAIGSPSKQSHVVREVFDRGFLIQESVRASVSEWFPASYETHLITSGGCSCSLFRKQAENDDPGLDHHRVKYEKLGWSRSKIDRALREKATTRSRSSGDDWSGIRPDVTEGLLNVCRIAHEFAFYVHFYHGDIESEKLLPSRAIRCTSVAFHERARMILEDELFLVTHHREAS